MGVIYEYVSHGKYYVKFQQDENNKYTIAVDEKEKKIICEAINQKHEKETRFRPVYFSIKIIKENKVVNDLNCQPGLFHRWGTSYEEFENGACQYTYGIVEDGDGKVYQVLPENIQFVA